MPNPAIPVNKARRLAEIAENTANANALLKNMLGRTILGAIWPRIQMNSLVVVNRRGC